MSRGIAHADDANGVRKERRSLVKGLNEVWVLQDERAGLRAGGDVGNMPLGKGAKERQKAHRLSDRRSCVLLPNSLARL